MVENGNQCSLRSDVSRFCSMSEEFNLKLLYGLDWWKRFVVENCLVIEWLKTWAKVAPLFCVQQVAEVSDITRDQVTTGPLRRTAIYTWSMVRLQGVKLTTCVQILLLPM